MIEKFLTAFFLAVSIFYLSLANRYGFGGLTNPLPGFLPITAGVIATIICVLLLLQQWQKPNSSHNDNLDWTKFLFIVIGLAFYLTIFKYFGYCLASFVFLFYTFKLAYTNTGIMRPLIFSGVSTSVFYLVFKCGLGVPFP